MALRKDETQDLKVPTALGKIVLRLPELSLGLLGALPDPCTGGDGGQNSVPPRDCQDWVLGWQPSADLTTAQAN